MARDHIRKMKRSIAGAAPLGAALDETHWIYWESALRDCIDQALRALFETARVHRCAARHPLPAVTAKH